MAIGNRVSVPLNQPHTLLVNESSVLFWYIIEKLS